MSAVGDEVYKKGTRRANAFAEGRWICTTGKLRVAVAVFPHHCQAAIWTAGGESSGRAGFLMRRENALHVVAMTRPCTGRMRAEGVSSDVMARAKSGGVNSIEH